MGFLLLPGSLSVIFLFYCDVNIFNLWNAIYCISNCFSGNFWLVYINWVILLITKDIHPLESWFIFFFFIFFTSYIIVWPLVLSYQLIWQRPYMPSCPSRAISYSMRPRGGRVNNNAWTKCLGLSWHDKHIIYIYITWRRLLY